MIVEDALKRMDDILDVAPLAEAGKKEVPKDASVELKDVAFAYDDTK